MAPAVSLDDRLARYGDGIRDQLASFPMARARELVDELAALCDELVRRDVATASELARPGPEGGGRPIGPLIELRSGEPALVRRYRAWQTSLRGLLGRLHTPATDPFYRTTDGERASNPRGTSARRSPPGWLVRHVEARDGDTCTICGVGPIRPVEDPARLVSGGAGGWYRVRVGAYSEETERHRGRAAAEARAAELPGLPVRFRIDHRIPAFHGGPHMAWNLHRVCKHCNDRKGQCVWPETLAEALARLEMVRQESRAG